MHVFVFQIGSRLGAAPAEMLNGGIRTTSLYESLRARSPIRRFSAGTAPRQILTYKQKHAFQQFMWFCKSQHKAKGILRYCFFLQMC